MAAVHPSPVRALCGAAAAGRVPLQAHPGGSGDVGGGGLPAACDTSAGERGAGRQRRRGDAHAAGAVTFATTELFLERLGLSSLTDLPDIAPLLPDVDMIDDLSESLDSEPRFVKLAGGPIADDQPLSFDVDQE